MSRALEILTSFALSSWNFTSGSSVCIDQPLPFSDPPCRVTPRVAFEHLRLWRMHCAGATFPPQSSNSSANCISIFLSHHHLIPPCSSNREITRWLDQVDLIGHSDLNDSYIARHTRDQRWAWINSCSPVLVQYSALLIAASSPHDHHHASINRRRLDRRDKTSPKRHPFHPRLFRAACPHHLGQFQCQTLLLTNLLILALLTKTRESLQITVRTRSLWRSPDRHPHSRRREGI